MGRKSQTEDVYIYIHTYIIHMHVHIHLADSLHFTETNTLLQNNYTPIKLIFLKEWGKMGKRT